MTLIDTSQILPLIIPAGGIIVLMLLIAVVRNHILAVITTFVSLSVALIMVVVSCERPAGQITQLLVMDGYARFYIGLIYAATIIACALSCEYIKHKKTVREEYYLFLMMTALGCAVLVSSSHFASLFIGIELLSLSLYVLITYTGTKLNVEAGIKYFVLTAVSVAFLLFGMALIYAARGSLSFPGFSRDAAHSDMTNTLLYLTGIAMFLIGIFFKLALVPFHFWIADVFEGASAPVAGFMGTASKGAVFAVFVRYFSSIDIPGRNSLYVVFAAIAVASMFLGNITALLQTRIKRVLGYSSIAHFGYLLVTVIAGGSLGLVAGTFYLTAYFITTLIAFGVITVLSKGQSDLDTIEDYRGLVYVHPFYAALLTVAMLSLAGIPLTAGFIAKFYIIAAGAKMKFWALLVILVINSVIGLFYYLRVTVALYSKTRTQTTPETKDIIFEPSFSWMAATALVVLLLSLLLLGIWPGPIVQLILMLTNP